MGRRAFGRAGNLETKIRRRIGRLRDRLGLTYTSNLSDAALSSFFEAKSVAIVGNARALQDSASGAEIDAHDIVVRMNGAPMPSARSHGQRTDVLATSIIISHARFVELGSRMFWWMTPAPMALPRWATRHPGFWNYQKSDHARLSPHVAARPSTGLMVIDTVRRLPCSAVSLFGFDFFSSFSLSNEKLAAPEAHNFSGERDFVNTLLQQDPRFTLVGPQ